MPALFSSDIMHPNRWATIMQVPTMFCRPVEPRGFSHRCRLTRFIKKSSYIYYTREALEEAHKDIILLAKKEGLTAHANSIEVRFPESDS